MRFKKSNIMIDFPTDSNDIIWRAGSGAISHHSQDITSHVTQLRGSLSLPLSLWDSRSHFRHKKVYSCCKRIKFKKIKQGLGQSL